MASNKIFVDGMIIKPPRAGAPDFVKFGISIKVYELEKFLTQHRDGEWLNIEVKASREGKLYAELDTWKPKGSKGAGGGHSAPPPADDFDDIPF